MTPLFLLAHQKRWCAMTRFHPCIPNSAPLSGFHGYWMRAIEGAIPWIKKQTAESFHLQVTTNGYAKHSSNTGLKKLWYMLGKDSHGNIWVCQPLNFWQYWHKTGYTGGCLSILPWHYCRIMGRRGKGTRDLNIVILYKCLYILLDTRQQEPRSYHLWFKDKSTTCHVALAQNQDVPTRNSGYEIFQLHHA